MAAGRDLPALARSARAIAGHRGNNRQDVLDHLIWSGFYLDPGIAARMGAEECLSTLGDPPGANAPGYDVAEICNLLTVGGLAGSSPYWLDHEVETGRRMTRALSAADAARGPAGEAIPAPRRFALSFERIFDCRGVEPGRPLRLRLPMPVEDARLSHLTVTADDDARLLPGRIEVVRPSNGDRIRLEARYAFASDPLAPLADDRDPAEWLAEREGPIAVTPRVRWLAGRLAAGRPGREAIRSFRDHLLDRLACGTVHHWRIAGRPATDWVLDHGWYDCLLGAALLASLCRAVAIPARIVGGYLLWDAPAEHFWMEAWLPESGWTSWDLMAWGLSAGGADPAWRECHAGAIDHRMKTQIFPRTFLGAVGVPITTPVQRLCGAIPGGTRARYVSQADGRPFHTDVIRVGAG